MLFTSSAVAQEPADAEDEINYANRQWSFEDADVNTWQRRLARFGLELPVELEGQISGSLTVDVPWEGWGDLFDTQAWRIGGSLTSDRLVVNDFAFTEVGLRLNYRDGVLSLEEFRVHLQPPEDSELATTGMLRGKATMELNPRGKLTAIFQVQDFALSTLEAFVETLPDIDGQLSGTITANVEVDRLRELDAWNLTGPVRIAGLTVSEPTEPAALPPAEVDVQLGLDQGEVTASNFLLNLGTTELRGDARLSLLEAQPWVIDTRITTEQLADLLEWLNQFLQREDLAMVAEVLSAQTFRGTAQLQGTLDPLTNQIEGTVEAGEVTVELPEEATELQRAEPLRFQGLSFAYSLPTANQVDLTNIVATAYGGQLFGEISLQFEEAFGATTRLRWQEIDLEALAQTFGLQTEKASARSAGSLNLVIPPGMLEQPAQWSAEAALMLDGLQIYDWRIAQTDTMQLSLREGLLQIPAIRLARNDTALSSSLSLEVRAPWSFDVDLEVENFHIDDLPAVGQLAELREHFSGIVNFTADLTGALDPLQITGEGTLQAGQLSYQNVVVEQLSLGYRLPTANELQLLNLVATTLGGQVAGDATLTFGNQFPDDLSAILQLAWQSIDAEHLAPFLGISPEMTAGSSSGRLQLDIPEGSLDDATRWSGTATLDTENLRLFNWDLRPQGPLQAQLDEGELQFPSLAIQLNEAEVTGSLTVGIEAPWNFATDLEVQQFRLLWLESLPQLENLRGRIIGLVNLDAQLSGSLAPLEITGNGSADSQSLAIMGRHIERLELDFQIAPESFSVTQLDAEVYEGSVQGNLRYTTPPTAELSAELSWEGIEAGQLLNELVDLPVQLHGATQGNAAITVPDDQWETPSAWQLNTHLEIDQLTTQGLSVASVQADLQQEEGTLRYSATGNLLGGDLNIRGIRPGHVSPEGLSALGEMQLSLQRAELQPASVLVFGPDREVGPIRGTFNLDASSSFVEETWQWQGNLQVANINVADREISSGFRFQALGNEQFLRIRDISGSFAEGQIAGNARWQFTQNQKPTIRLRLRRAQLEELLLLAGAGDTQLAGPANLDFVLQPGKVWRLAGTVDSPRAEAFALVVRNVRIPFTADWDPESGRVRLSLPSSAGAFGGGRMAGRLTARKDYGWTVDGNYRFYRVDLSTLLREMGSTSSYGQGRLTGTLTLSGRNVRSLDRVQATLLADLEDTQARHLPLVSDLQRYVPGFSGGGLTQFTRGRLEARLVQGVIQLDRLSLASNQLSLFIDGRIELGGRLRLKAVVATGQIGGRPVLAEALLNQFIAVAATPVALMQSANEFLSNRVIYLEIRGTLARPIIRPRPFQSLPRETVRFFLRRATGGLVGSAAAAAAENGQGN